MNISDVRTRVKGGATAFGATALNERSHLVMKSAERVESPTARLLGTVQQSPAEPNCGVLDPLIQALVDRLPKSNSIWSIDDRAKWLKAAAMAFNLVYKTE